MNSWTLAFLVATIAMVAKVTYSSLRKKNSTDCPVCARKTRYHEPYFMCDECKSFAGVRVGDRNYF
jgi:predicted  nucleic acid-binding Zn ribbon protein